MVFRLLALSLSHFRSHQRAVLRFDGRPVVFCGANGAGKTNLIEAISLLSPGRGLRRAAPDELIRQPQNIGWKITAELIRGDTLHDVETSALPGQSRSLRIDGKLATQSALGHLGAMLWLTPAMDRLWIEGAEGRRRFLDRMALSFHPGHAEAAQGYERAMRERNRLLREQRADGAWYGALEAQMAQCGAQMTANRQALIARLAQASDPTGAFPAADLALACTAPTTEAALAEALAEGRRRDMAAGRSLTGPHRADLAAFWREKNRAAAQCSTGEQKALLLSIILANARALQADTGAAPILLLDEAAAHLDSARCAALYDQLCDLGAHAFLTGTDAALFAPLEARAQVFALADQAGCSTLEERPMP